MEEKNDTSRNIIIAIIIIAIIAVIGYFIYNSTLKSEVDAIENGANDVIDNMTNDNFDEVGAFSGKETYGDEEDMAKIELVLNSNKTASLVLVYGDTKKYTGTYTKSGNTITFTANTTNDTIDNSARNITDNTTNDTTRNTTDNTMNNNTTRNTTDDTTNKNDNTINNNNTTNDSTNNDKTFTFTISGDGLYYISKKTNNRIKLNKVDRNTLQYINE